jgi:hypothetical protein
MQPNLIHLGVCALFVGCAGAALPPADLDRDGIADVADLCPSQHEDGADPQPDDGCKAVTP